MALNIYNPDFSTYLGSVSTGVLISACLMATFVILAVGCSFYHVRRMRKQLNLLDDETRAHRATEEELCTIGAKPTASRQKRDPWQ
jgi:hypothetical protein